MISTQVLGFKRHVGGAQYPSNVPVPHQAYSWESETSVRLPPCVLHHKQRRDKNNIPSGAHILDANTADNSKSWRCVGNV